jgi:hypothetical protein
MLTPPSNGIAQDKAVDCSRASTVSTILARLLKLQIVSSMSSRHAPGLTDFISASNGRSNVAVFSASVRRAIYFEMLAGR